MGWPADVRTVNCHLYQAPAVETLLRWDDGGKPGPHLATGWKVADDKKSITFNLRKGVKFHDGTDFNAQAVKWGFELFMKTKRSELQSVESMEVIDDHTLRLNLKYFDNLLLTNLCYLAGPIASPTAGEKMGKDAFCLRPVGTGPFKIKSVERDVLIRYEKFDGYWQKGKPYLDAIEISMVKDPMTAIAAYKSSKAHLLLALPIT
jgi:ABC-type transport system substrate-binding protein